MALIIIKGDQNICKIMTFASGMSQLLSNSFPPSLNFRANKLIPPSSQLVKKKKSTGLESN